jgi:hypothetical protein
VLGTTETAIRRLHELPREILDKHHEGSKNYRRFWLSALAETLRVVPVSELPKTTVDWQTLWDAAYWSYREFGQPFRPLIAARAYRVWQDCTNIEDMLDDDSVNQVRSFVEQVAPSVRMRSMVDGCEKRLCDFLFEWWSEQLGPVFLKKMARRLESQLGKALQNSDHELPHRDIRFSWEREERQRNIVAFTHTRQMAQEGARFENCMASLIGQAMLQEGGSPFFVVRDKKLRTRAHLEVGYLAGVFHLIQIEGPGNSDADEASIEAAIEFVRHLNTTPPAKRPRSLPVLSRDLLAIDQAIQHAIRRWVLVPVEDNTTLWRIHNEFRK